MSAPVRVNRRAHERACEVYGRAYERACGENRRAFKARLWAKQARVQSAPVGKTGAHGRAPVGGETALLRQGFWVKK
jgi:hypothetical protein